MNRPLVPFLLLGACLLLAPVQAPAAATRYTLTDLGEFAAPSRFGGTSGTMGINNYGQVAGTMLPANRDSAYSNAFRTNLYDGSPELIGTFGGRYSRGLDINDFGQITGVAEAPGNIRRAFRTNLYNGSLEDLGTLGGAESAGYGINQYGQVTGWALSSNNDFNYRNAFRTNLYNSSLEPIGTFGGSWSEGHDINDYGQVAGIATKPGNLRRAFRTNLYNGSLEDLGTLGGAESAGYGINQYGQVTGWADTPVGTYHAFRTNLYNSSLEDLGTLNGSVGSIGADINSYGHVTGHSTFRFTSNEFGNLNYSDGRAFLYDTEGMVDLNSRIDPSLGWTLVAGTAINDAGQIAGFGFLGEQRFFKSYRAFILTPVAVPEPSSMILSLFALLGLMFVARRSGKNRST